MSSLIRAMSKATLDALVSKPGWSVSTNRDHGPGDLVPTKTSHIQMSRDYYTAKETGQEAQP